MISLFRKTKWRIHYVDKIGDREKCVIIPAKTISQAKETFCNLVADKTITKVVMI